MRTLMKPTGFARQRGLTLMIVLIALISLSLASMALIRSVDTGSLVMGNLGFKQAATAQADDSVERAMTWLVGTLNGTLTNSYTSRCSSGCSASDTSTAYYATSLEGLDIAGHNTANTTRVLVDWDNNNCAYATSGTFSTCIKASQAYNVNGYATSYIITRMCKTDGDPNLSTNSCAVPTSTGASNKQINKGEIKYGMTTMLKGSGGSSGSAGGLLMFRVVVRSQGPRNTVSYTDTYVSAISS